MYDFKDEKLAEIAKEVKESWPYFLEAAFTPNAVGDAIHDHDLSEKEAVEKALIRMREWVNDLLEKVGEA